jgi:hypothetical protein
VDELLQSGLVHVVDVDIKGYFELHPARAPHGAGAGEHRRRAGARAD